VEQLLEVEEDKKEVRAVTANMHTVGITFESNAHILFSLAQGVLSRDTLAVGMARLGQPTQQVSAALLACGEFCCPFAGMVKMLFAAQALWYNLA
jgi:hypothetical protein